MNSSIDIDTYIISLILSITFISTVIFIIFYFYLLKRNNNFKKNYTALLINSNQMIEMMIPIHEQQQQEQEQQKSIDQYSIPIQTETLHSCHETNQDYYQSILSKHDIPCFPVRETNFQICPRFTSQMFIDLNKGNYFDKNQTKFI